MLPTATAGQKSAFFFDSMSLSIRELSVPLEGVQSSSTQMMLTSDTSPQYEIVSSAPGAISLVVNRVSKGLSISPSSTTQGKNSQLGSHEWFWFKSQTV